MTAAQVTKLMSTTRAEFERSLSALAPEARLDTAGVARIACGGGHALLHLEVLAPRRIGGLVVMPQARVTLDLAEVPECERGPFMARFDLAFQRGGG